MAKVVRSKLAILLTNLKTNNMEQHPNCRCEFEDFKESHTLVARCDVCFTLDGRTCIGGVHKRREQQGEFHDVDQSLPCIS